MRLWGAGLAAVVLLGACTSDPAPREPTATTSTPSATPTPDAVAPTMPAQASQDSPEGAAAFVQHYIDVFNYAAATGDVDGLSALSSPDCTGCQRYITLYRDTYAAGGYFRGGEWKASSFDVKYLPAQSTVTSDIRYGESNFRRSEDELPQNGASGRSTINYTVSTSASERVITKLSRVEKP